PEAGIARRIEDVLRHETNVSRRNTSSSRRKPALRAGSKTSSVTRPTSHAGTRLRHAGSRHCAPDRRRLPSRDQRLMPEHVSARPQGALNPFTREKIFSAPNALVSLTEVALFAVGIFVNFRPSPVFVSMGLILESRRH